jgi:O-antigen ligase
MLVPLVGVAFVLASGRPVAQFFVLLLTPAAFLVAVASGSRGPILTLLILGVVSGAVHLARTRAVRARVVVGGLLAGAAIAAVLVVASAALPAASLSRFSAFGGFLTGILGGDSGGTTLGGDTSSEARVRLFGVAIQMWMDHPLLGAGTGGFATLSPSYVGPLFADQYPHNSVLQFASEYGILGVAVFAAFVGMALARAVPRNSTWTTVRLLAAFFLFNSLLSNDIVDDRTMWGLMLLLLLARVVPGEHGDDAVDAETRAQTHRGGADPTRRSTPPLAQGAPSPRQASMRQSPTGPGH